MRRLPLALVLACVALPALGQEDTSQWPCHRFRDVGSSAELEMSEDGEAATITREGEAPIAVQLGTCGTGLVGYCARGDGEAEISTIVPVHGWLHARDDGPASDFLIVDGAGMFEAACEE